MPPLSSEPNVEKKQTESNEVQTVGILFLKRKETVADEILLSIKQGFWRPKQTLRFL